MALHYRPSGERGLTQTDWLISRHTFSFGEYYDTQHVHFGALRVINDDWLEPGKGFETHAHRDMEIVTIVLEGALAHKDSLGNGSTIAPGEVQRMSAGTGIRHSEFNASPTDRVHILQIWILPNQKGPSPEYDQVRFPEESGRWQCIVSPEGRGGSIRVHQDVRIHKATLAPQQMLTVSVTSGRQTWLHWASGQGRFGKEHQPMVAGDGLGLTQPGEWLIIADTESTVLVFDLTSSNIDRSN